MNVLFDRAYLHTMFGSFGKSASLMYGRELCDQQLLNNPDDRFLLHCIKEPGHRGDHHCAQTGFAWASECNYRQNMIWGAAGSGWQILPDAAYEEIFTRVLTEPQRWHIVETPGWRDGGWMLQAKPVFEDDRCSRYHVNGFTGEMLVAAWRHLQNEKS